MQLGPALFQPAEICESTLIMDHLRGERFFGFLFGVSYDLFRLIPLVSGFATSMRQTNPSKSQILGHEEEYQVLKDQIWQWQHASVDQSEAATSEIGAGMILQSTLFIFLQLAFYEHRRSVQEMVIITEPLVGDCLKLFNLIRGSYISTVVFWPLIVLGCCARTLAHRDEVLELLRTSSHNVPVTLRAIEVLNCLWYESDKEAFGLSGLESVFHSRELPICFG